MEDQATRHRDRALVVAILGCWLLGVVCIAVAAWETLHPGRPVPFRSVPPEMGFIAGAIFIGFAIAEAIHRLLNGPQSRGRHARSSSTD